MQSTNTNGQPFLHPYDKIIANTRVGIIGVSLITSSASSVNAILRLAFAYSDSAEETDTISATELLVHKRKLTNTSECKIRKS